VTAFRRRDVTMKNRKLNLVQFVAAFVAVAICPSLSQSGWKPVAIQDVTSWRWDTWIKNKIKSNIIGIDELR
jgi:hypothetical protein